MAENVEMTDEATTEVTVSRSQDSAGEAENISDMSDAEFAEYIAGIRDEPESTDPTERLSSESGEAKADGNAEEDAESVDEDAENAESADENPTERLRSESDEDSAEENPDNTESKQAASDPTEGKDTPTERLRSEKRERSERTFTQEDVNRIVGERLKARNKADAAVFGEYDALKAEAARFYGGDNPMEQMLKDLRQQNAQAAGLDEAAYTERLDVERKAREYDAQAQRKADADAEVKAIQERWRRESEELKGIVQDFDFDKAMATNDVFKNAVLKGASLAAAYMSAEKAAAHLQNASHSAGPTAKKNIKQNAATKRASAGKAEFNPATASDKDFNAYIR
ncbi:MAG: hypothetical protein LUD03_03095, partial [Firmicutes bacterium]|nr:hypothetical protein [Bacillota bacterium]